MCVCVCACVCVCVCVCAFVCGTVSNKLINTSTNNTFGQGQSDASAIDCGNGSKIDAETVITTCTNVSHTLFMHTVNYSLGQFSEGGDDELVVVGERSRDTP